MYEVNNRSFYAIIPANVRYDKRLSSSAKLLYGEITALCNGKGFCHTTKGYFAQLYGVSEQCVGRWISSLKKEGYIYAETLYAKHKGGLRYLELCIL